MARVNRMLNLVNRVLNLVILQDTKAVSLYSDIDRCRFPILPRQLTCKAQYDTTPLVWELRNMCVNEEMEGFNHVVS